MYGMVYFDAGYIPYWKVMSPWQIPTCTDINLILKIAFLSTRDGIIPYTQGLDRMCAM